MHTLRVLWTALTLRLFSRSAMEGASAQGVVAADGVLPNTVHGSWIQTHRRANSWLMQTELCTSCKEKITIFNLSKQCLKKWIYLFKKGSEVSVTQFRIENGDEDF